MFLHFALVTKKSVQRPKAGKEETQVGTLEGKVT